VGKIYSALAKFRNDSGFSSAPGKLKKSDYAALLRYDRTTGKLDLSHPMVTREKGTLKRLIVYRLIEPDGTLTPAGLAKYNELTASLPKPTSDGARTAQKKQEDSIKAQPISAQPEETVPVRKVRRQEKALSVAKEELPHMVISVDTGEKEKKTRRSISKAINKQLIRSATVQAKAKVAKAKPVAEQPVAVKPSPPAAEPAVVETETKAAKEDTVVKSPAPAPLATVSSDPKRIDPSLISLHKPGSFEAEQFKILRTNLLFPVSGNPPCSVMVTSALTGEGKSFVASNLATSVAMNINRYVLLIDCDLRKPSIHNRFGFGDVKGLSEYLSGGTSLEPLLLRTPINKLTILPAGRPPENPAELLSSQRMSALLNEVTERYSDRLIILDSPPSRLTSESGVLARWVDGILVVVKYSKTPRDVIADLVEKIGSDKILGAIINGVDVRASRYYGKYYGKYGGYYK